MAKLKTYSEFVNESIDIKYWAGYNKDTSGQGNRRFELPEYDFDDCFDYAVEDWNAEADGSENRIKGAQINKVKKLAMQFFKKAGYITVNIAQAMISQEAIGESEVNEALIDAVKNPIKWKKIKNNAKKYQKAKVAQALNDVDFAKRKEKGKAADLPAEKIEVLNQANKAKNAALKDAASNVAQRMDDLATTTGLKRVAQLAKTKASLAANQIALKAATGEEAKQLKIKQKELTGKATDAQKALADYESTAAKKAEKPAVQEMPEDKPKTTTKPETTTETKPKTKLSAAEEKKAEQKQKLGDQIGKAMQAIEKAKQERVLAQTEEDKLSKKLSDAKGTDAETALARSVADADKAGKDIEKAIKDLQKNVKDLQQQQKDLNESFEYVAESVSQKFARLRPNL